MVLECEEEITELKTENAKLLPDAQLGAAVKKADDLLTMTVVAKMVGTSATAMFKLLHEKNVIHKVGSTWVPQAKYQDKGLFDIKIYPQEVDYKGVKVIKNRTHLYVTGKGVEFVLNFWSEHTGAPNLLKPREQ
jgi:phage antirepressor YoqD-like protein